MKETYYYENPWELAAASRKYGEYGDGAYVMKVKCIGAMETSFKPYGEGLQTEGNIVRWGTCSYPLDLLEKITLRVRESIPGLWSGKREITLIVENSYVISLMAEDSAKKLQDFFGR